MSFELGVVSSWYILMLGGIWISESADKVISLVKVSKGMLTNPPIFEAKSLLTSLYEREKNDWYLYKFYSLSAVSYFEKELEKALKL
jgi:hypothetical protein